MPETDVVIDLERDIIGGAVRVIRQTFRVALVGIASGFARDVTRVAVEFGTRWLSMNREARDEPPISDLPVILPRGGGYGLHLDMVEGDLGVVLACDGPVRGLFENGEPVTPQFPQGHEYGCAVVIPGGRVSSSEVPTQPPNTPGTMLIGAEDGSATVTCARAGGPSPTELGTVTIAAAGPSASIRAGSDTSAIPVACAPQVDANFDLIGQIFQALPAVPGDPGIIAALKVAFGVAYTAALQPTADAKLVVDGPLPGP